MRSKCRACPLSICKFNTGRRADHYHYYYWEWQVNKITIQFLYEYCLVQSGHSWRVVSGHCPIELFVRKNNSIFNYDYYFAFCAHAENNTNMLSRNDRIAWLSFRLKTNYREIRQAASKIEFVNCGAIAANRNAPVSSMWLRSGRNAILPGDKPQAIVCVRKIHRTNESISFWITILLARNEWLSQSGQTHLWHRSSQSPSDSSHTNTHAPIPVCGVHAASSRATEIVKRQIPVYDLQPNTSAQ